MALQMRITSPILLLSCGAGPTLYLSSKGGYGPLACFCAEQGFVVIQPTYGDSKVAGLPHDASGASLSWRSHIEDMTLILDWLEKIEQMIPALAG